MAKLGCKETSVGSSFGKFLYDRKLSKNHFPRKLNEVVAGTGLAESFFAQ